MISALETLGSAAGWALASGGRASVVQAVDPLMKVFLAFEAIPACVLAKRCQASRECYPVTVVVPQSLGEFLESLLISSFAAHVLVSDFWNLVSL